jgi:16S rRNA (cytosine1402-N4)-methyltransferase
VLDGTLGAGGHAGEILRRFPGVRLLGADQDDAMLRLAEAHLAALGPDVALRARVVRARLSELAGVLVREVDVRPCALLLDLGVASPHFDDTRRGFSFQADAALDMRLDTRRTRTAADVLNTWDADDLADLFFYEGGEPRARQVARAVVEARRRAPILRTLALAEIALRHAAPDRGHQRCTRVFQALRRVVNEEGDELCAALALASRLLPDGGVLAVLSFHSGEDGAVKRFLAEGERRGRWELLHARPVVADARELALNPRARSAKLRAAVRRRSGSDAVELVRAPAAGRGEP